MSQRAIDITKISDLKAVKRGDIFEWYIDDEEFRYCLGDKFLKGRTSATSGWEVWPLEGKTKTFANRKIFDLIK